MAHVTNNSGNAEWYTPRDIIDAARVTMGSIDCDPASCAVANDVVKAKVFYTKEQNGLIRPWFGNIWLNPPYSNVLMRNYIARLKRREYTQAIILTNNATETEWFYDLASVASAICLLTGRTSFWHPDKGIGAPLQGQVLTYIGDNWQRFFEVFRFHGTTARILK